jgi:hypothetical protein
VKGGKLPWHQALLVILGLLIGISSYGPLLSERLKLNLKEMIGDLSTVGAPIMGTVLIILLVRLYWNRW